MIKWQSIALFLLVALANSIRAQTNPRLIFSPYDEVDSDPIYVPGDKHKLPDSVEGDVMNDESQNLQQLINQMVGHMPENQQDPLHQQPKITNVNINKIYSPPCSPCEKNDGNCNRNVQQSNGFMYGNRLCGALTGIYNRMEQFENQLCDGINEQPIATVCRLFRMVAKFMQQLVKMVCDRENRRQLPPQLRTVAKPNHPQRQLRIPAKPCRPNQPQRQLPTPAKPCQPNQRQRQLPTPAKPCRPDQGDYDSLDSKDKLSPEENCKTSLFIYQILGGTWADKCFLQKNESFCEKLDQDMEKLLKTYIKNCDPKCSHVQHDLLTFWQEQYDQCIQNQFNKEQCEATKSLIDKINDQLLQLCPVPDTGILDEDF